MLAYRTQLANRLARVVATLEDASAKVDEAEHATIHDVKAKIDDAMATIGDAKTAALELIQMRSEVEEYEKDSCCFHSLGGRDEGERAFYTRPFRMVDWDEIRARRKKAERERPGTAFGFKGARCKLIDVFDHVVELIDAANAKMAGAANATIAGAAATIGGVKTAIDHVKPFVVRIAKQVSELDEYDKDCEFRWCLDDEMQEFYAAFGGMDAIRVARRKKEHALAKQQKEDPEPMRKWLTMKPEDAPMDTASSAQEPS